ncbi:MAG TPA: GNAT family N-acetyltransferase [Gemmatimonadaceae bacterium]|jgi:ribosomal protein S18 acetylase RimI-like enzyme
MSIMIRRFETTEWLTYKNLRLRALADSPDAFGSTFARESARADDEWRDRLERGANSPRDFPALASVGDVPAGIAWTRFDDERPRVAHLFQVWVAPEHRGTGVGRRLVEAAIAWSRRSAVHVLELAVTSNGSAAAHLYRDLGFSAVGEVQPLRPGSELESQPMRLVFDTTTVKP